MPRIFRPGVSPPAKIAATKVSDVFQRQPPGTVTMLFNKVPVLQVPHSWQRVPLDLHLDVELRPATDGTVVIDAPMRAGTVAKFLGRKTRKMGILPDDVAEAVQLKLREGALLRAQIIDAPPPRLRGGRTETGIFVSIRCKA